MTMTAPTLPHASAPSAAPRARGYVLRALGLALATTIAMALALLWAAPANAHAQLLASDPEDGAEITEAPEEIVLTFNEEIEQIGAEVVIADADGAEVHDGDPEITGPELTQALATERPAGEYTVQWRVVSADGHPVSGEFTFDTAEAAGAGDDAASSTQDDDTDGAGGDESTQGGEDPATEDDDATNGGATNGGATNGDATDGDAGDASGNEQPQEPAQTIDGDVTEDPGGIPWGLIFALALVGVALALVVRARRQIRDIQDPPGSGSQDTVEAHPDDPAASQADAEPGDPAGGQADAPGAAEPQDPAEGPPEGPADDQGGGDPKP